jgi:acyl-CoA synthetase (AMP-forming)/AMP-acid ligase II
MAWNGYRHLELYFGVSGTGRVLHTVNPRLHPDQIAWIANHAQDQVMCFDMTFLPIIEKIHAQCTTIQHWIALCDDSHLPAQTSIPGLRSYESWLAPHTRDIVRAGLRRAAVERVIEVWCSCPFDENRRRYAERERHPGHYDVALLPELDEVLRTAEPLGLGEVLRVETDRDLDAVGLARSVLAAAGLEPM